MKLRANPARRVTIRHFADQIRDQRLSASMREIQVGIAAELLREQHGIRVSTNRLLKLTRP